jgi:hypothetical protein
MADKDDVIIELSNIVDEKKNAVLLITKYFVNEIGVTIFKSEDDLYRGSIKTFNKNDKSEWSYFVRTDNPILILIKNQDWNQELWSISKEVPLLNNKKFPLRTPACYTGLAEVTILFTNVDGNGPDHFQYLLHCVNGLIFDNAVKKVYENIQQYKLFNVDLSYYKDH